MKHCFTKQQDGWMDVLVDASMDASIDRFQVKIYRQYHCNLTKVSLAKVQVFLSRKSVCRYIVTPDEVAVCNVQFLYKQGEPTVSKILTGR